MKEHIAQNFEDPHEAFFKTDIHWKPQTGMFAAGVTSEYLNKNFGFNIDMSVFDKSNFNYVVYKDRLLGSEGRKLTVAVADPEDISLMYPKANFEFKVVVPDMEMDKTGDFSVFYDYTQVLGEIEYYDRMAYETYLFGGNALWQITNLTVENDKRVLMLCDSFGRTFAQFFSLGVKQLDVIDLRKFSGSLKTYIDVNDRYDALIIVYNPGAIGESSLIVFD